MKVPHDNLAKRYTTNLVEGLVCHLDRIALDTFTLASGDLCQYGVEPFTWDRHTIPCARVHLDLDDPRKGLMYCRDRVVLYKDLSWKYRHIRIGLRWNPSPCFTLITVSSPGGTGVRVRDDLVSLAGLIVEHYDH